jgi:murein DD-endopeptidase MepM/ murein hydrolase activator NlpD
MVYSLEGCRPSFFKLKQKRFCAATIARPIVLLRVMMNKFLIMAMVLMATATACKTTTAIFGKKTPHEQYADNLNKAGLQQTAAGGKWFTVADKALNQPLNINLPYQETGYFDAASPAAAGYRFSANKGEKIAISVTKKPLVGFNLFMDLWQPNANGSPKHIAAADSTLQLTEDVDENGTYILRLQPELLAGGEYTITIKTGPSLAFPIGPKDKPRIISTWGMDRDGGARRHEGIDIAAAKRTPLLACADGYINSTRENNLGGKVAFLRPDGKNYSLYYAHMDEVLVQQGQRVNVGDTIGLVGNTGNAARTAPHLHFGIYTNGGAINPLPFIDVNRPQPQPVTASLQPLNNYVRAGKNATLVTSADKKATKLQALPDNTILKVIGASASYYKVATANDSLVAFVPAANVLNTSKSFTTYQPAIATKLLDKPDALAASKTLIAKGEKLDVLGTNGRFYFVSHEGQTGWVAM